MSDMLDSIAPDVDFNAEPEAETPEPAAAEPQLEVPVKEEPKAEPKTEEQTKVKTVPFDVFHAKNEQVKEWRAKAERIEKDAQERFQKLEQRLERLANPPPAVPTFADDPAGNLQHQVAETKAELAAVRQESENARKNQEASQFEQQIAATTQASEVTFAKEHPDYLNAVQHLQAIADKNLLMMGVGDPAQRQAQIRKDALAMSLKALQMGKSPAEVAYQLAVNYGYKAGSDQSKVSEAAKKIETIQAGQKTASLPAGGSKTTALTLSALEQMDDDDFNKLVDDPSSWNKLVRQMV